LFAASAVFAATAPEAYFSFFFSQTRRHYARSARQQRTAVFRWLAGFSHCCRLYAAALAAAIFACLPPQAAASAIAPPLAADAAAIFYSFYARRTA